MSILLPMVMSLISSRIRIWTKTVWPHRLCPQSICLYFGPAALLTNGLRGVHELPKVREQGLHSRAQGQGSCFLIRHNQLSANRFPEVDHDIYFQTSKWRDATIHRSVGSPHWQILHFIPAGLCFSAEFTALQGQPRSSGPPRGEQSGGQGIGPRLGISASECRSWHFTNLLCEHTGNI